MWSPEASCAPETRLPLLCGLSSASPAPPWPQVWLSSRVARPRACVCLGLSHLQPGAWRSAQRACFPGRGPLASSSSLCLCASASAFVFTVASVSPGRKGGELASAVHAYTKTGDPSMRSLVQHILSLVSHPVLSFLYRWIYDGELEDAHHEVRRPAASPQSSGAPGAPRGEAARGILEQQGSGCTHGLGLRCLKAARRRAHPWAGLAGVSLEQ